MSYGHSLLKVFSTKVNALPGLSRSQMMSQLDGLIEHRADTSLMEAVNDFEWRVKKV